MTTHNTVESYSLRILSPFSGTARIIQQDDIRAISNNGVNWRIQIQTNAAETLHHYTLFGLWTRMEGLKELTRHQSQSSAQHRQLANGFVRQLPDWLDSLSFPLHDMMECWLLDKEQQPLALLIACQTNKALPKIRQSAWIPCSQEDHTFISLHLQLQSHQHGHSTTSIYHRDLVTQQVHQAAAPNRQIQWFQRQTDGSGIGLEDDLNDIGLAGRLLPADDFPHYLVRQHWDSDQEQQLINDFFQWQSPWLLSLPNLNHDERQQLEIQACTYPQRLHALHHLYPQLLQKELINKTLIQAKLEKTMPSPD